jgi:DnaJ domain
LFRPSDFFGGFSQVGKPREQRMKTLYDLLGALPNDDAEDLRAAFRKAAKATHPDTNTADPEAPLRFRQVMRANAILSDPTQRAAYDKLMVITAQEAAAAAAAAAAAPTVRPQRRPAPAPAPIRRAFRKIFFDGIAVAALSTLSIGGYLVFDRLSNASSAPNSPSASLEVAARPSGSNAAVAPVRSFDAASKDDRPGAREDFAAADSAAPLKPAATDVSGNGSAVANVTLKGGKSVRRAFADIDIKPKRVKTTTGSATRRTRTAASHHGWSGSASNSGSGSGSPWARN